MDELTRTQAQSKCRCAKSSCEVRRGRRGPLHLRRSLRPHQRLRLRWWLPLSRQLGTGAALSCAPWPGAAPPAAASRLAAARQRPSESWEPRFENKGRRALNHLTPPSFSSSSCRFWALRLQIRVQ